MRVFLLQFLHRSPCDACRLQYLVPYYRFHIIRLADGHVEDCDASLFVPVLVGVYHLFHKPQVVGVEAPRVAVLPRLLIPIVYLAFPCDKFASSVFRDVFVKLASTYKTTSLGPTM